MSAVERQATDSEPLRRTLTTAGVGLTGATVRCDVRRSSDGLVLDFADSTFKAVGAVGTRYRALAEVDAVNWRGLYEGTALDLSAIVGGVTVGTVLTITYYTTAPSVLTLDDDEVTVVGWATPTNITAGTITTVTNLTNAAAAGDFTATMKTSITTAATAATPTVTVGSLGADAITAASLAASAVTEIQSGLAVPGSAMTLADDAITAAKIAAGAIGATEAPLLATISTATEKTNDALYNARRIASNGAITQMADDGVTAAYTATGTDVNGDAVTILPGTVARTTALTAV